MIFKPIVDIVKSQFKYSPLILIFCSKIFKIMINMIYSSSLSVVLDDESNPFTTILDKVLDFTNYQWNIQVIMIKLFKIVNNLPRLVISNKLRLNSFNLKASRNIQQRKKTILETVLETVNSSLRYFLRHVTTRYSQLFI